MNEVLAPNPFNKWPRNLACYCGSGTKFKKCCADKIHRAISKELAKHAREEFNRALHLVQKYKSEGLNYKLTRGD